MNPPEGFTWISRTPGVLATAGHTLVALTSGRCRVRLRIAFSGPLAWLASLLYGTLTQRYIEQEASALKATLESRASGSPTR
jgi:hypothetical protein